MNKVLWIFIIFTFRLTKWMKVMERKCSVATVMTTQLSQCATTAKKACLCVSVWNSAVKGCLTNGHAVATWVVHVCTASASFSKRIAGLCKRRYKTGRRNDTSRCFTCLPWCWFLCLLWSPSQRFYSATLLPNRTRLRKSANMYTAPSMWTISYSEYTMRVISQ